MNISLKPEQEQFIQSQIQQGNFANAEQVIGVALRLLEEQSPAYKQWLTETREKVANAMAQIERGEAIPGEVVIAELRDKISQLKIGDV